MKKYESIFRAKWTVDGAVTIVGMISALEAQIKYLRKLDAAGCTLRGKVEDDYAFIETNDPKVAKKFQFWEVEQEGE
jgi:hypothetical protein